MTEVELCRLAIAWLQEEHWDVYQEVEPFAQGPRADIVAVRGKAVWVIEAKMSLSLSLIEQAIYWLGYAHYVSVLIPTRSQRGAGSSILHHFGIGTIQIPKKPGYDGKYNIECYLGRFNRPASYMRDRITGTLSPEQQTGEFGEAGNNFSARWTPYKSTMSEVKRYLERHGPATLNEILKHISHHYSNDKSALGSMRKALDLWEKWCHVDYSNKPYLYSIKQ